jgi:hypothetical protein
MIINDPLDSIKFVLPEAEKQALKRACFIDDITMAQFLRKKIREYILQHTNPSVANCLPEDYRHQLNSARTVFK